MAGNAAHLLSTGRSQTSGSARPGSWWGFRSQGPVPPPALTGPTVGETFTLASGGQSTQACGPAPLLLAMRPPACTQSHQTLCDPTNCSLPSSSIYGIFLANTGVGCLFLLQRISPTQGQNLGLLNWWAGSLPLCHVGIPAYVTPNNSFLFL